MKPVSTLVLVASEEEALFCANHGVGKGLNVVKKISAADFPDVATRYSDEQGRSQAAGMSSHHAGERSTTERRQMREAFARHVGEAADAAWKAGDYQRFARVAPPAMLGALRDVMNGPVETNLAFEMDKDLVKIPTKDLPKYFEDQASF